MLKADLKILSTEKNGAVSSVLAGVSVIEDSSQLAHKLVKATVSWGDSSPDYSFPTTSGKIASPIAVSITHSGSVATLKFVNGDDSSLAVEPFSGTFSIAYGASESSQLDYSITAQGLQSAISGLGATVIGIKESSGYSWAITFSSSAEASQLTAGTSSVIGLKILPKKSYAAGNYSMKLSAENLEFPVPVKVQKSVSLSLASGASGSVGTAILTGPILPADIGYPNKDQWNFDTATDLKVLASSVKMIINTKPGERVMMPTYGCNVQYFLFDPLLESTDSDIKAEVQRAVNLWEPRVEVFSIGVERLERTANLNLQLVSKLNRERFQLNVELER